MTDKPVLNTPGEMLVAARTAAGLDLDQVVSATKIPINILRHLERDEYHRVSGPLYVNSFLRTYATEVGLEPSLVLEAYARFSGERIGPAGSPGGETVWAEEEVQIKRVGLPWVQIGVASGAGLALILLAVWFFGSRGGGSSEPSAAREPRSRAETVVTDPAPAAGEAGSAIVEEQGGTAEAQTQADEAAAATPEAETAVNPPVASSPPPPAAANLRLPAADEGIPSLNFADGNRWPLVLRVISAGPAGIDVVRDSDREPMSAVWGSDPTRLPTLPTIGVEHGRPYRVREGYATYWGARDQFSLRLDSTAGVRVELNGEARDLTGLKPGQELILFLPSGRP